MMPAPLSAPTFALESRAGGRQGWHQPAQGEVSAMDQQVITRRKVLAAAGTVGAAAALTGVRGVQASGGSDDSVVGTWVLTVTSTTTPATQPPFASLVSLAAGGVLITFDALGNSGLGAWEHNGSHGFESVFETLILEPAPHSAPTFIGTLIVRPKGTVNGDKIHGTYTADFQPAGGPLQPSDHGTFTGSRLEP
jgi:hypothetical protein